MYSITTVQNGIARFVSAEIEPKLSGIGKWLFGAAAGAYIAELPTLFDKLKDNPIISPLGIVADDNSIDIDKVYNYIKPQADKAPAVIELPMLGRLTLGPADVDALYNYIRQS